MCAPFSPTDTSEQTVTAFDLGEVLDDLIRAATAYRDLVVRLGINGETAAQLRKEGVGNPTAIRVRFENAVIAYRATARNCLAFTSGTYADEMDLAQAQDACLEHNSRSALSTAMRRADTAEAADAALTASARDRGADVVGRVYPSQPQDFVSPAAA